MSCASSQGSSMNHSDWQSLSSAVQSFPITMHTENEKGAGGRHGDLLRTVMTSGPTEPPGMAHQCSKGTVREVVA